MTIDIIVIGLNEGLNLKRCFSSINKAIENTPKKFDVNFELIYVDSGSQDGSVEIAKCYADKVILLTSEPSAAAARMAGLHNGKGEYCLFLDGDMELDSNWFIISIPIITKLNDNIAGIIGIRDDISSDNKIRRNVYGVKKTRIAPHFGGAVMLKRTDIERAGGYNPLLKSFEEPDFYARLLSIGKKVLELNEKFILHKIKSKKHKLICNIVKDPSFATVFKLSIRRKYLLGFVKVFRYTIIALLIHIASLIALFYHGLSAFIIFQIFLIMLLLLVRKPKEYVLSILRAANIIYNIKTKPFQSYSLDYQIVHQKDKFGSSQNPIHEM